MSMPVPCPTYSAACTGCEMPYADEESGDYLFTSRERLGKLMYADGWQVDPPLCPGCQWDAELAGGPGPMPLPGVA